MPFKKGHKLSVGNKNRLGKPHSAATKKKLSESRIGKFPAHLFAPGVQEKARLARTGLKRTFESKMKMRITQIKIAKRGSESHLWKGGLTPVSFQIRHSPEMKVWKEKIFIRDDYTCQMCFTRSGNGKHVQLCADHIKPFSLYPELRFDLDNGRTLCWECHRKTNTFAGRMRNYKHKDFPAFK